jgi:histidine triad (HIT) family protein
MSPPESPSERCIFCEIVAGRSPAYMVYEDPHAVAFLDLFPFTRGHLLVVPKRHVPRLTDLRDDEHADYLRALSAVCHRIERLSTDYNVALNQGARAGQVVFHLHFHIIPRYGESNPFGQLPRVRLTEGVARELMAQLSPP